MCQIEFIFIWAKMLDFYDSKSVFGQNCSVKDDLSLSLGFSESKKISYEFGTNRAFRKRVDSQRFEWENSKSSICTITSETDCFLKSICPSSYLLNSTILEA